MEINYNKKLYSIEAIKSAIEAYEGLAEFNLSENENYFLLELKNVDFEYKNIIREEFSNYVLSNVKFHHEN